MLTYQSRGLVLYKATFTNALNSLKLTANSSCSQLPFKADTVGTLS